MYIVCYSGPFGFIKPWTAVRDELTFSQQFLTPSIIEGIRQKLQVSAILRHRISYSGISRQQEQTQPRAWEEKLDRKTKIMTMKRPRSILKRGVLLNPLLHLAFPTEEDAVSAYEQHICLCRNEDILFPTAASSMSEEEFDTLPGFELIYENNSNSFNTEYNSLKSPSVQSSQIPPGSFIVGYNRFARNAPMYGRLHIIGNPIQTEAIDHQTVYTVGNPIQIQTSEVRDKETKEQLSDILAKSIENGGTTLIDHLEDVIAAILTIAPHFGLDPIIARKAAALHDIGKAHPEFQHRLRIKEKDSFIALPPLRHELSSLLFLPLFPQDEWSPLIDMIVGHHKSIYQDSSRRGILDLVEMEENLIDIHIGKWEEWSPIALDILSYLQLPVHPIPEQEARAAFEYVIEYCEAKGNDWSKWRGLLMSADHFASAFIEQTETILEKTFQNPDLSRFSGREDALYPLSQISVDDKRYHTIVVAPTGAGKTDFLMRRCKGRVFYTLPFQASINAMYERMKVFVPDADIRVLHSASRITGNKMSYEEKILQSLVGSSIKVLTPHQIAAIAFGTRGFESVALDIMGADVILDEIHSYSDVALSMVLEIVKTLKKLGCYIHIGTATMPSALLDIVYETLGGNDEVYLTKLPDKVLNSFDRHRVFKETDKNIVPTIVREALENNEKVLVVCNRVDEAQQRFDLLTNLFPNIPAMLIHSRFRRKDRATLEKKLKKEFDEAPGPCIVVATQVVEVSLDISFDRMITDCAPLDSMIQRFGRVNRRRTQETLGVFKNVHVLPPPAQVKDALPYNLDILKSSFEQLPHEEILSERTLQHKIDAVYPTIDIQKIEVHAAYKNNQFMLKELSHRPKSVIMEMLDIESATCILLSDREAYIEARSEQKTLLEIPIPRSAKFKKFTRIEELTVGSRPFVVPDELYTAKQGLKLQEIDNYI